MATREEVLKALEGVMDPELNRNIVELGMVKEVKVDGGKVGVTVALTVPGCPMHARIQEDVRAAVAGLSGVREVEVEMTSMTEEERNALANKLMPQKEKQPRILDPASKTRVIAVASGKGGVGKSTVTVNLAAALSRLGKRVGILDADIYGFSVPRMLGLQGKKPTALNEGAIIPLEAYGMQVISMGSFAEEDTPIVWRGPMLMKVLEQFLQDVMWDEGLDYLMVDMPPGTGDVAISLYQLIPHSKLILVTTPQVVSTSVAARVAHMAESTRQEIVGVIENMSYFICPGGQRAEIFGNGGGESLAKALGVPLLGQIPLENEVRNDADTGKPVVLEAGASKAKEVLAEIARKVGELAEKGVAAERVK
ncbi:MAG: Mrp/NBP35 family ATP-binding protein [Firmicutes bacterium]|nr:Mrp/NBP35 family ATP-binding protein [Bacillota bacterium]